MSKHEAEKLREWKKKYGLDQIQIEGVPPKEKTLTVEELEDAREKQEAKMGKLRCQGTWYQDKPVFLWYELRK
jgi:hypothetical protein